MEVACSFASFFFKALIVDRLLDAVWVAGLAADDGHVHRRVGKTPTGQQAKQNRNNISFHIVLPSYTVYRGPLQT